MDGREFWRIIAASYTDAEVEFLQALSDACFFLDQRGGSVKV